MRKKNFPRIVGLVALYGAIFVLLAAVQFTRRGKFSIYAGDMLISGVFQTAASAENTLSTGRELAGRARVFFGGLEFRLEDGDNGVVLIDDEGNRSIALPKHITLEDDDTVRFRVEGGTELVFSTSSMSRGPHLEISGEYASGISGVEIPFRPVWASLVRGGADGRVNIAYNGAQYQFGRSVQWEENGRLVMNAASPSVVYRAIPEQQMRRVEIADCIIPQARSTQSFNEAVLAWKNAAFSRWDRSIAAQPDEDMVIAYNTEALRRGSYRAGSPPVPQSFVTGNRRGWRSAVFIGGITTAFPLFNSSENETGKRITELISTSSSALLGENHAFKFLATRGLTGLFEQAAELVRSINPDSLNPVFVPGIFEGYVDYDTLQPNGNTFERNNPFERLIEPACALVLEGIYRTGNTVFVCEDGTANIGFNLRLGKAIRLWAAKTNNSEWLGMGRSLALSVLALEGSDNTVPAFITISADDEISTPDDSKISAAVLYRLLDDGEYTPRMVQLLNGQGGVWAWTAASVSASRTEDAMDLSIVFPTQATHYLFIRGIPPFASIRLYETGWRQDSQFERYDSPGWMYYRTDQTLVIKMRHRSPTEQVRIIFREEAVPQPSPQPAETSGPSVETNANTGNNNTNDAAPFAP